MKLFQKLRDDLGSSIMRGDMGPGLEWLRGCYWQCLQNMEIFILQYFF